MKKHRIAATAAACALLLASWTAVMPVLAEESGSYDMQI